MSGVTLLPRGGWTSTTAAVVVMALTTKTVGKTEMQLEVTVPDGAGAFTHRGNGDSGGG